MKKDQIVAKVDEIVGRVGSSADRVIPLLQEIQNTFHYLPEDALRRLCEITPVSPQVVQGISTFYSQFRHHLAGTHMIQVCTGTACHVKGAQQVYDAFCRELKLEPGEYTDRSGIFSIEKVACLGCCTLAPVIRIDDVTYGHVMPEKVGEILIDFLKRPKGQSHPEPETNEIKQQLQGEIRIGLGSCCVASGSSEVRDELDKTLRATGIQVEIKQVGCVGICNQVPIMEVVKPGETPVFYAHIKPDEVKEVVLNHFRPQSRLFRLKTSFQGLFEKMLAEGAPRSFRKYLPDHRDTPLSQFLGPQRSIATEHRGIVSPTDIAEYQRSGGFAGLRQCLGSLTPQQVIDQLRESGLRGRGGAGFPTGRKWQLVHDQDHPEKIVICNGDEGDPGAFMDRMLLESYPYRIIEGMLVAGYATGASKGLFYIRAEYPLAVKRIREALKICREQGLTGPNILDSAFSFEIDIFEGAGAFVCGEETALIASVEGKRGIPRLRPPYPAVSGLQGKPTLINNTETFSLVPWIMRNGADRFSSIGTPGSKGTKVFALAGKVRRGGLIEVPMGISVRSIVEDIGGGVVSNRNFKAVQIGGPSGGCLPASLSDLPIDYEALAGAGAMMGSGGLIVLDDTDCMVDMACYFLSFTQSQSCGQCTFCRIGTRRMLEILEKIRSGKGTASDLEKLERLAHSTQKGSLCGLGKTAPNPVLSTLRYFRHEYEEHLNGFCRAGRCAPLIRYSIDDTCIGCTKCAQRCPVNAIGFKPYETHEINVETCIKCDICRQVCPVDSVKIGRNSDNIIRITVSEPEVTIHS